MKKKHLLFLSVGLFSVSSLSSQLVKNGVPSINTISSVEEAPNQINAPEPVKGEGESENSNDHSRVTFWSEDFNGGLTTANGTWTTDGPNGTIWEHTTSIDPGCFNGGAQGNFTTAANGYLLYNSDLYNCVDAGTTPPTYNTDVTTGSIVSPVIDCSAEPSVMVTFEHNFRYCCNAGLELHLSVSNDGGTSWTAFNVKGNTAANDYPNAGQTAEVTSVNITSIAANQANVQIKFTWNPTGNSSSHYFWAIDDIELEEAPDHDLVLQEHLMGSAGTWTFMPYFFIPTGQVTDIGFSSFVKNNGNQTQTNSTLTVDINAGLFNESSTPTDIISLDVDSLFTIPFNPGNNLGTYDVTYNVASDFTDENPLDNEASESFEVTEFIYARDRGVAQGSGGAFNQGNGYEVGNVFDVFSNQTLYAIDFHTSTNSEPEDDSILINVILYEIDMTTGDFNYVETSDDYYVSQFGSMETVLLNNPVDLQAGSVYLPVVKTFGNGGVSNDLVITNSGNSPQQTTFIYLDDEADWFYSTNTPIVRMNFDFNLGNEDLSILSKDLNISPNPFNNTSTIEYSINAAQDVSLKITDLTGKVVFEKEMGTQNAGTHTIELDASNFAEGTYLYSIIANGQATTKRMIVTK